MMNIELIKDNESLHSALFGNIAEELLSLSATKLVDMDKKVNFLVIIIVLID